MTPLVTQRCSSAGQAAAPRAAAPRLAFFRSGAALRGGLRPSTVATALPRNPPSPPQQPNESSEPSAAGRPRKPHVWTVGVDFGTYASGFGYSKVTANPDEAEAQPQPQPQQQLAAGKRSSDVAALMPAPVKLHHAWPDQPLPDYKTRTVCLYQGNKLEAWGWAAWRRWSQMSDAERTEGGYVYVEEFKLLLQGGGSAGGGGGGAGGGGHALPPGLTEVQVVADFLSELRGYIYKHLARTDPSQPLDPAAITWCLTVPAMWDEGAKAKMRQAANRAGMARASDPASLSMVLEPEAAAAAAVMHQQRRRQAAASPSTAAPTEAAAESDATDAGKAAELSQVVTAAAAEQTSGVGVGAALSSSSVAATLVDGDVLLVLDCGGGTADITMHRVVGSGTAVRLQEAAAGKGVLAGGRFVDEALWRHLRGEVVGPEVWDEWRRSQRGEWMQTATEWEASKSQPRGPVTLQLRPYLMDLVRQRRPAAVTNSIAAAGGGGGSESSVILRDDGSLVVPEEILDRQIYGPVVDQILAAATDVVDQGRRGGSACTKMLLTGGMANSPYVRQRVRQLAQEVGLPLLLPKLPQALVVSGAVLFGQYPSLVSARRSRLTYGICCRSLWTADDAASASAFGYPTKLWKDEDREYVADGVFEQFVGRNQLVGLDEVVRRTFCPTSRNTTAVGIDLFATESEEGRYVGEPGMRRVASVTMELPAGWTAGVARRQEYDIEVELRFGGTEITLFARDPRTRNAVATTVQWTPEPVMGGAAAGAAGAR